MKLIVDNTLPPRLFQKALISAARQARADHEFIRARTDSYVASGWDADTAREMAHADLAIARGALQ